MRAGRGPGRRLDDHYTAGRNDQRPVPQVAADDANERAEPVAECLVGRDRPQRALGVLDLGSSADRLSQRGLRRRGRGALVLLDPGQDGVGDRSVGRVGGGQFFQGGQRDLRLLACLADQADRDP